MNTAALGKRLPTLMMGLLLTYSVYSIRASVVGPAAASTDLVNGLEVMAKDVLQSSTNEMKSLAEVVLRDPFQVTRKAADAVTPATVAASAEPTEDPLTAFVRELSLDATFLQGKTRIAIISGRIYHQGQHLIVQGESDKSYSPLFVDNVQAKKVTLGARGKTYELGYPDQLGTRPTAGKNRGPGDGTLAEIDPEGQLAFYKRLLNSPLGKLGKGLTGNLGQGAKATSARSHTHRGSAAGSSQ